MLNGGKMRYLEIIVVIIAFLSSSLFAGELDILLDKLTVKGVITQDEAQQIKTETDKTYKANLAAGQVSALPFWIQNIAMTGDMTVRMQDDWNSSYSPGYERVRERVRLRVNFDSKVSEYFKAGFGFSTGCEKIDATADELGNTTVGKGNVYDGSSGSAYSTFSGFGRIPLMLNLAFVEYDPVFCGLKTSITTGKMRQGTQVWNATDLLWESSLNPDGFAFSVTKNITDKMLVGLTGSWLSINDLNSPVSNPSAAIGQVIYTWDTEKFKVKLGISEQNLDVAKKNCGSYLGDNNGVPFVISPSGVVTANSLDYEDMAESFAITYKNIISSCGISILGDVAKNGDSAAANDSSAYCVGLRLGYEIVAGYGQWQILCLKRRLEGNSWLNNLGASTPYNAAHNSAGSQAQASMGLSKNASLAFTYYKYDKIEGAGSATPWDTLQSDVIYKF
jgi:hypothetical protein